MIVKVQQSISPHGEVLIYNQSGTVMWHETDPEKTEALRRIMNANPDGRWKLYWRAHLDRQRRIVLDQVVEDQPW